MPILACVIGESRDCRSDAYTTGLEMLRRKLPRALACRRIFVQRHVSGDFSLQIQTTTHNSYSTNLFENLWVHEVVVHT
jgi:hypothetical protein